MKLCEKGDCPTFLCLHQRILKENICNPIPQKIPFLISQKAYVPAFPGFAIAVAALVLSLICLRLLRCLKNRCQKDERGNQENRITIPEFRENRSAKPQSCQNNQSRNRKHHDIMLLYYGDPPKEQHQPYHEANTLQWFQNNRIFYTSKIYPEQSRQ